nr:MAG TPA: hypothetical protein [Caudoviricetes sp.]
MRSNKSLRTSRPLAEHQNEFQAADRSTLYFVVPVLLILHANIQIERH